MKNIRRFRLFLLFFISLFVSLIFTTIIANSGTAYSAEQPAAKHQQLNRTATAVVSSPRVGVDKNRSDSPSSILGDAQNVEFVGQIGGATKAVAVQEEYAYVGEGPRLTVLDLTDPAAPAVLGKTPPLPGEVREVAVVGNYGYIAAKEWEAINVGK